MAYKKSQPRTYFEHCIHEITLRVKETNNAGLSSNIKQMVYCAAIIECSASLECYIDTILSSWVQNAQNICTTNSALPKDLRLFMHGKNCVQHFINFIAIGDEGRLIDALQNMDISVLYDNGKIDSKKIMRAAIYDKKYPSAKNLKKIFRRFGIKDIHIEMSKQLKSNAELLLSSFMDIRASVAHSYPAASIFSKRDILTHLKNSLLIVSALDKVTNKHLITISDSRCWP